MEIKPALYIRADGGPKIGLGHLIRCSALAQMLKDDFHITLFCKEIPTTLERELEGNGLTVKRIKSEEEFFRVLKEDLIIILDVYSFDLKYQKRIKDTRCKLVFVDDFQDRIFLADLIINHSPGIKAKNYSAQPYTRFALGLEYALLRPAFLEQAKKRRVIQKIENLLITFGGADPYRITEHVLRVALEFSELKRIIIVSGIAFDNNSEFLNLIHTDQRIEHLHALNEQQMLEAMLNADLAIVPASGVLFEALSTGCTIIAGRYAENQELLYENCKKAGLILDAGYFENEEIRHALEKALTKSPSIISAIDGNSRERIVKMFKELQKESLITIRKATEEDIEITFRWATDKDIRRYAFQQHQITYSEHSSWFLRKIKYPDCIYMIGEVDNIPVGSIRFDIEENEAIISYLVEPKLHGQNLGSILLKKGIERLKVEAERNNIGVKYISGFVMKENLPSINTFKRFGFDMEEDAHGLKFSKQLTII